jgi:hypothetical protein
MTPGFATSGVAVCGTLACQYIWLLRHFDLVLLPGVHTNLGSW